MQGPRETHIPPNGCGFAPNSRRPLRRREVPGPRFGYRSAKPVRSARRCNRGPRFRFPGNRPEPGFSFRSDSGRSVRKTARLRGRRLESLRSTHFRVLLLSSFLIGSSNRAGDRIFRCLPDRFRIQSHETFDRRTNDEQMDYTNSSPSLFCTKKRPFPTHPSGRTAIYFHRFLFRSANRLARFIYVPAALSPGSARKPSLPVPARRNRYPRRGMPPFKLNIR